MKVNAVIRDLSYKKHRLPLILPIVIEPLLVLLFAICGFSSPDIIPSWITILVVSLGIVLYLALIVYAIWKANKVWKTSWLTEEFDFVADNKRLTLNGKPMHTNIYKSKKVIYVHDMGDNGKPYDATFYASVLGEDYEKLLLYIEENGVKKEREDLSRGAGKYGWAAPVSVSKYRKY